MNLYLVSGRVHGDDDDTAELFAALDVAGAVRQFKTLLLNDGDEDFEESPDRRAVLPEVYVITITLVGEYVEPGLLRLAPAHWLNDGQPEQGAGSQG